VTRLLSSGFLEARPSLGSNPSHVLTAFNRLLSLREFFLFFYLTIYTVICSALASGVGIA
jgi:hypothetical protein